MFRRIFLLAAVCFLTFRGVSSGASEQNLLPYVPAGCEYLVSLNVGALADSPACRDLLKKSEYLRDEFADFSSLYSIRFFDCRQLIFCGKGEDCFLLAEYVPGRAGLAKSLAPLKNRIRFSEREIAGKKVLCIQPVTSVKELQRTLVLDFLTPHVLQITDAEIFPHLASLRQQKKSLILPDPEGTILSRGFFSFSALTGAAKIKKGGISGFDRCAFSVVLKQDQSLAVKVTAQCADAQLAAKTRMLLYAYLNSFAGIFFCDDAALGQDFMRAVQLQISGKNLVLTAGIPQVLLNRLLNYLAQAAKRIVPEGAEEIPLPASLR